MSFHDWEKTPNFDPAKISVNSPRWVNYKGSLLTEAQEMADNAHISQDFMKFFGKDLLLTYCLQTSWRPPPPQLYMRILIA